MRIATILTLWMAAMGIASACAVTLALPQELTGLVWAQDNAGCGTGTGIASVPSPLSLVDISAQAMGHIWAQPAPAPNAKIERAQQVIRQSYEMVIGGLEAVTESEGRAIGMEAGQALEMQQKLTGR